MNRPEIIKAISEQIQTAQETNVLHKEFYRDADVKTGRHEFLFFVKPEITLKDEKLKLDTILDMMLDKIEVFELSIKDIRILGAAYLDKYNIIARHYGVINAMSRTPLEYFSNEASEKFSEIFGSSPFDVNLLGSLEFLEHYTQYDPLSLNALWQESKAAKLAGGTYCAQITIDNEQVFLINGFHPLQLIHFTEKGRSIVAFTLTGNTDWSIARNNFIGKTNPSEAMKGSLRNELFTNQKRYGLESVSASRNGFHLSAGPVEGLVELIRYCSDYASGREKNVDDFLFGRQLLESFTPKETEVICGNAMVMYQGKKISVFDLTEEKNSDIAIALLGDSVISD